MRSLVVAALVAVPAGPALAAPGDPRAVQGRLEWPASLAAEPFVVVRGDDGRAYYADVASAQRRTPGPLAAGSRVAVLGIEGSRAHEVTAMVIGAGDVGALGVDPSLVPATPATPSPGTGSPPVVPSVAPPPPAVPSEPMWRVEGTVQSVAGRAVTVQTPHGTTSTVDVSQLAPATVAALRPGQRVALFGVPRADRRLVANGYIQSDPGPPAASPRTGP